MLSVLGRRVLVLTAEDSNKGLIKSHENQKNEFFYDQNGEKAPAMLSNAVTQRSIIDH